MDPDIFIPRKTIEEMNAAHPPGTRHDAMFKIAIPLLGNGMADEAVFAQLRATFPDADKTDKEIRDVITWCSRQNPTPSVGARKPFVMPRPANRTQAEKPKAPEVAAREFLNGSTPIGTADWYERSPIKPDDGVAGAIQLLTALYEPHDHINMVVQYLMRGDKANPQGGGQTLMRDQWIDYLQSGKKCHGHAGCWIRPNPCKPTGSGKDGAITDADILSHRFVMIESDTLTIEQQLSIYAKLRLPLAAIIHTGGDSVHAWFKIDAQDAEEYELICTRIYAVVSPIGFDKANKNPSRLSRLPGVPRKIGGKGLPQHLCYLDPSPPALDLDSFEAFAAVVKGLVPGSELGPRISEYFKPKPPPIMLDFMKGKEPGDGFAFRDGEVTIWSGISGHGKSTMLCMVMLELILKRIPFFIASLEYRPEKLCEMMARVVEGRIPTSREVEKFVETFGNYFCFADEVGSIDPQELFKLMRSSNARYGARHFFIDSLMRVSGLEEDYPAQGAFVNELQAIAKRTGGHIHLVAHPRKIDEGERTRKMDVKGSSLLVNNADNVVTMRRNMAKLRAMEENEMSPLKLSHMHDAEFAVEKQRETGWQGVIRLRFDQQRKVFELFNPPKKQESYVPKHMRDDEHYTYE